MVQIIGWLLCVYLIVKGFELCGYERHDGSRPLLHVIGAAIAWISAPIFFMFFNMQGEASTAAGDLSGPNEPTN